MGDVIEVFFATNRNLIGSEQHVVGDGDAPTFGDHFNPAGPHFIRFGSALVEERRPGEFRVREVHVAPEALRSRAEKAAGALETLGSHAIFETLRERMQHGRMDTLALIHGFASNFYDSLERAAQVKAAYRFDAREPNMFVFSWPSNGSLAAADYYTDRDDARASGVAMARAFLKLRDFLVTVGREKHCEQSIHLIAHSMGNYALRHALQAMRSEVGDNIPRLLDHIFLMAADEDDDAFEHDHKLRLLPNIAKAVHVYFSSGDEALVISDVTKRNPDRLGSAGPRINDNIPRKITLLDCRHVDFTEITHARHQYYRIRPEVIADVRQVLAGLPASTIQGRDFIHDDRSFRLRPADPVRPPRTRRRGGGN